jgi:hypothetical protein
MKFSFHRPVFVFVFLSLYKISKIISTVGISRWEKFNSVTKLIIHLLGKEMWKFLETIFQVLTIPHMEKEASVYSKCPLKVLVFIG